MNPVLIVLLSLLGLLVLVFIIATVVLWQIACSRNDKTEKHFEEVLSSPFYQSCRERILDARDWLKTQNTEEVCVTSFDGLRLAATYLPCENARGTLLLFHGWRGGPITDFGYSLKLYHALGLNLLLVHQRAQGRSEGRFMTFGIRERHDVHTWVRWHTERFGKDVPLLLGGISMGASTVLMACGEPFAGDVRGVIADCGFTDPKEILTDAAHGLHLPAWLFVPAAGLLIRCFSGFRPDEYSTLTAMKTMRLPVLFAHGEADMLVPCEMSKRNFDACASTDKTLLLVPGAAHGQSFPTAPERYTEELKGLLERALGAVGAGGANE